MRAAASVRSENRRLRDERDLLLSVTRQRREDLRASVIAYAIALQHRGTSLERAICMVRDAISSQESSPAIAPAPSSPTESDGWVLEAFRAA